MQAVYYSGVLSVTSFITTLNIHFCQAAVSIKKSNLLICFCSFDSSCRILEKDNFIKKNVYCIVLAYKIAFFLTLFVSI